MSHEEYLSALFDAGRTNRNFRAHILMTTREVCPVTGRFGKKTDLLDKWETGPGEILGLRKEWEKRTNAALERIGSSASIDLRSYKAMAADGDAPDGLIAQDHLGPRLAAQSRALQEGGKENSEVGKRRQAIHSHNKATWHSWMVLRALEREKSREAAEVIARDRETARKKEADAQRHQLLDVQSAEDAEAAIARATQFDSLKKGSPLAQAISWALRETDEPASEEPEEFTSEVDLETYEPPPGAPPPEPVLEVKRVRVRGPRSR